MAMKKITLETPMTQVAAIILQEQLSAMQKALRQIAQETEDLSVSATHQSRIALRKSLAILEYFSSWLDPDWQQKYRKGMVPLLRRVGKLRDRDVLSARLAAEEGIEPAWLQTLDDQRKRKRQKLADKIASKSLQSWLGTKTYALGRDDVSIKMSPNPIAKKGRVHLHRLADSLPVLLTEGASRILAFRPLFPDLPETVRTEASGFNAHNEALLHQLRQAVRDYRYILQFGQRVEGFAAPTLLRQVRSLQDQLGAWHDAVIALNWGWRLAEKRPKDEALIVWLSQKQAEKLALLESFETTWQKFTPQTVHAALAEALQSLYSTDSSTQKNEGSGD